MNPGNTKPYRFKRKDGDVCLRSAYPLDYIHDRDTFGCRAPETLTQESYAIGEWRKETWFYTADRKLRNSGTGEYLTTSKGSYEWQLRTSDTGDTWTWDNTNKMLKNDRNNMCLDMRSSNDDGIDVKLAGCDTSDSAVNQKIELSERIDPDNYGKAQCKRADQHSWAWNKVFDSQPSDQKKYECCLAQKENTTSAECGYNYCNENGSLSDGCKTFLQGTYCTNNPTLPLCRDVATLTAKANYCSVGTRLLDDQICKDTCNMDSELVRTKCETTALRLCKEDKNRPECGCFGKVYDSNGDINTNDPDYKKFTEGMDPSMIPSLGSPECWLQPCAASTLAFSQLFRRKKNASVMCPACIQNLSITNSNFDEASIRQSCIVKPNTGGTPTVSPTPEGTFDEEETTDEEEKEETTDEEEKEGEQGEDNNVLFFGLSSFFFLCCILVLGGLMFALFSRRKKVTKVL